MKACISCGINKDQTEFYKHKGMADGHLNKCKSCCIDQSKQREFRLREDPNYVEVERARAREKYHRLGYKDKQKPKSYLTNKNKNLHRDLGLSNEIEAHHWNYAIVEDVIIMSRDLHRYSHRFLVVDDSTLCHRTLDGELLDTKEKHLKYIISMKLQGKAILILPDDNPESAKGVINPVSKKKPNTGRVIGCGPGCELVQVGDYVQYKREGASVMWEAGLELHFIIEDQIIFIHG